MGHHHTCCNRQKVKRGLWSPEEDEKLMNYISTFGHGCWSSVPRLAGLRRCGKSCRLRWINYLRPDLKKRERERGLRRCGKSCRLRWINYLRPDLKRGSFYRQEATIIVELHRVLGNKWVQIAKHLPGRTDNEVKNFWNSSVKKKFVTAHENHPSFSEIYPTLPEHSAATSSNQPPLILMNPSNNFNPNHSINQIPIQTLDPFESYANFNPMQHFSLAPHNFPYHHYHPIMLGSDGPNQLFMGSNLEAAQSCNHYPMFENFAITSAPPPFLEDIAGIDVSFMAAPPSPLRYLDTLVAELESPIPSSAVSGSSSAASTPPPMPCSSSGGSSFLDDAGFVSFWGSHRP